MALPALWVGLLYDTGAQGEAAALVAGNSGGDWQALHRDVPRLGLAAPWRGGTVASLAREVVAIAKRGLAARGLGEEAYLAPIEEIAATGRTLADRWLDRFATAWGGDVARIFDEGAL